MATATDALTANDPLNNVIFFGARLREDIRDQLTKAEFDASTDQVAQITLSFLDPNLKRMANGLYTPKIPVMFEDYSMEVASVDIGEQSAQELVTVKCRARAVRNLKNRRGKKVYKGISPSQFVKRECKAVGVTAVVQESAKRKQVARDTKKTKEYDNPPSSWTTFHRLAGEIGFIVFEAGNVVYFGKPSWLLERAKPTPLRVNWKAGAPDTWTMQTPECSKSLDSKVTTINFRLPISRARECKVGTAVLLSGVPGFNGYYLLNSVNYSLVNAVEVMCTASTPEDPEPLGVAKTRARRTSGSTSGTSLESSLGAGDNPRHGSKSAFDFTVFALKQSGDRYVYGAEASLTDPNPDAFDCSELVQWAAAQVGVYIPDGSSAQVNYCIAKGGEVGVSAAIRTRGALLYKPGHIAISLGNGETIEAVNPGYGVRKMSATSRSFNWTAGVRIPGMRY
jgi:cell wall-associated NlpC family hydrolase